MHGRRWRIDRNHQRRAFCRGLGRSAPTQTAVRGKPARRTHSQDQFRPPNTGPVTQDGGAARAAAMHALHNPGQLAPAPHDPGGRRHPDLRPDPDHAGSPIQDVDLPARRSLPASTPQIVDASLTAVQRRARRGRSVRRTQGDDRRRHGLGGCRHGGTPSTLRTSPRLSGQFDNGGASMHPESKPQAARVSGARVTPPKCLDPNSAPAAFAATAVAAARPRPPRNAAPPSCGPTRSPQCAVPSLGPGIAIRAIARAIVPGRCIPTPKPLRHHEFLG